MLYDVHCNDTIIKNGITYSKVNMKEYTIYTTADNHNIGQTKLKILPTKIPTRNPKKVLNKVGAIYKFVKDQ